MNNNDERDYAEEAANTALMREEDCQEELEPAEPPAPAPNEANRCPLCGLLDSGMTLGWHLFEAHDNAELITEIQTLRNQLAEARQRGVEGYRAGYRNAAAEARNRVEKMPYYLGDEGWQDMEDRSAAEGYPRSLTRDRRRRDDFTTVSIEGAYQYARSHAIAVVTAIHTETAKAAEAVAR